MPIEIRELVIRAAIEEKKSDGNSGMESRQISEYDRIKDQLRELKQMREKRNER